MLSLFIPVNALNLSKAKQRRLQKRMFNFARLSNNLDHDISLLEDLNKEVNSAYETWWRY